MPENTQVKSKKRVADHGEVFTNKREVNAMLDLVKDESERMKDRILLNAKRRKLLEKVLLYVVSILAVIMVVICFIAYYFNIQ